MVRVAFSFYRRAGVSQGKNLRVRNSGLWMEAAAHYFVVLDEDAADLGVGSRGVGGDRLGQVQGLSHEVEVVACRAAVVCHASTGRDEPVRDGREEYESHACARVRVALLATTTQKLSQMMVRSAWVVKIRHSAVG